MPGMHDRSVVPAFEVGFTADFRDGDGNVIFGDIGLSSLAKDPTITHRFLPPHPPVMAPEHLRGLDAIISLAPKYTAESLVGLDRLGAIIRFGVGYDMVDVAGCTGAGVALVITAGAVDHSMAESILAWMLALAHRVLDKDRLVREGAWNHKLQFMGSELRDRTVGLVGCGGIGSKLVGLVKAFGVSQILVYDPYLSSERAQELRVELTSLAEVMSRADFISINCPLTDATRGLIGPEELALVKPSAYLINTARGGIVQEQALHDALASNRLAGAAVDVFEAEPAGSDHPLARLPNTILAPHAIGWTHELFRDIGRMACEAALSLARGQVPAGLVNPEVLDNPKFIEKLSRRRAAASQ
jgi:phosphoglycerate dehydrogenase-like enzyme